MTLLEASRRYSFLFCFLGGAALGLTNRLLVLAPLQLIALAFFFVALDTLRHRRWWKFLLGGLLFGAAYSAVRLIGVELPAMAWSLLFAAGSAVFVALAAVWRALPRQGMMVNCFGIAGAATILEFAQLQLLSLYGTAQSLALAWASVNFMLQTAPLFGFLGVTFTVVALSALMARLAVTRCREVGLIIAFISVLVVVAGVNMTFFLRNEATLVNLGVMGWPGESYGEDEWRLATEADILPAIAEAGAGKADVLILPENTFRFTDTRQRDAFVEMIAPELTTYAMPVVFGYFDEAANGSFAAFVDTEGELTALYQKTHLTPMMNDFTAGNGSLVSFELSDLPASILICQDDVTSAMSNQAARAGAKVLLVPSNDWSSVARSHLFVSVIRAAETGSALARATRNGFSAVISFRGYISGSVDHLTQGQRLIMRAVGVRREDTPYTRWGDAPVLALSGLGLGFTLLGLRKQKRPAKRAQVPIGLSFSKLPKQKQDQKRKRQRRRRSSLN